MKILKDKIKELETHAANDEVEALEQLETITMDIHLKIQQVREGDRVADFGGEAIRLDRWVRRYGNAKARTTQLGIISGTIHDQVLEMAYDQMEKEVAE